MLGNLTINLPSIQSGNTTVIGYTRRLDLVDAVHTTRFLANGDGFETNVFCSFPDQVCVYAIQSSTQLPTLEVRLGNELVAQELQNVACKQDYVRLRGVTQMGPPNGMQYDSIARLLSSSGVTTSCINSTGALSVVPNNGTRSLAIVVGAGTDYDAKKGTAEFGYSFRGEDPGPEVERTTLAAAAKTLNELRSSHIEDFNSLAGRFELVLPDSSNSTQVPTSQLIARYETNHAAGDPYLENILFDYATYMFISSSRPGSLPPNLQGRWSESLSPAWSSDYHANINLQMNHWTADQTGLTDLQSPLWDYMADTWVPRGSETAELLYAAPGWVVHDEINIFGHTGMKNDAGWANYPAAAAWMMQHVFDHWDYSRDTKWLASQGYPMLKGIAQFWLSQLQLDTFSEDGTLVVNPCNSPEHGPTTFGCAHYQQLVHQVFEAVLSVSVSASEVDTTFISNVTSTIPRLDKGLHVGSFGQIKEWKLPSSFGYEVENDTHRHLSELVGWYPGYSLSSFQNGYTNATIQSAVREKLYSRGNGTGADANAGWEKVWRSACWARLNDTERAYFELRYAIDVNFAGNGLSMYSAADAPFQIDANFGIAGAMLSMLIVDLPGRFGDEDTRTVVLGPAIPAAWAGGHVKGLRLRGGGSVDFGWDEDGTVNSAKLNGKTMHVRVVNKIGAVLAEV